MMNRVLPLILFIFLLLNTTTAASLDFRISADKLSLQADHVPLQDILKHFADNGARVRIDPRINPVISTAFKDRELHMVTFIQVGSNFLLPESVIS